MFCKSYNVAIRSDQPFSFILVTAVMHTKLIKLIERIAKPIVKVQHH